MGRSRTKPCPLCGKPAFQANNPYAPFCSERCKLIDLGQWASGKYRVPGEKVTSETPPGEENQEKGEEKKK
jgi:endogenous inhibitor of DNA gyrase (YacG/DUF329 family)